MDEPVRPRPSTTRTEAGATFWDWLPLIIWCAFGLFALIYIFPYCF